MLHTTGTAYLSKTRPVVTDGRGADFTLELVLVDNMGRNPHTGRDEKEAWRVRWSGADAQAFWHAHQADLTAGTPLRVELHRMRAHAGAATYPPLPELRARVKFIEIMPTRLSGNALQLSNTEQRAQRVPAYPAHAS